MPKTNDHIVVVGGCDGIGLAIARAAHTLGCPVTITGRGVERTGAAAASIGPGVKGVALDLLDSASIASAVASLDPIDHMALTPVHPGNSSVSAPDSKDWAQAAQVKLVAYLQVVNAALPKLKPSSSIVLFGGVAKSRPYPGSTMVSIVNGGIVGMTRTLAIELAPIRSRRLARRRARFAALGAPHRRLAAGRRRGRSDAGAHAWRTTGANGRRRPRRVLPDGQPRRERNRPANRRRLPTDLDGRLTPPRRANGCPNQVAHGGLMHRRGRIGEVGGDVVLEPVFADVAQQTLQAGDLHHADSPKGGQGIVGEGAAADIAANRPETSSVEKRAKLIALAFTRPTNVPKVFSLPTVPARISW